MNYSFDLKIKELKALKKNFILHEDILVLNENGFELIGCRDCYMQSPTPNNNGFKLEAGDLINYYEKFKEGCTIPKEVAINIWMCPRCNRVFRELMPVFETGYKLCQPTNH
jgi:hypothetical protein